MSSVSSPSPLAAALRQAQALRDAGDLTTARAILEDAVDAARPMLGEDHPELLGGQHALATLHREADDPAAARRVLEEAIAAGELHLGEADPLMLALSFDLGTVAEELGNRHEARRNFTRVAAHGRAAFGEDHHMVRTAAAYLSSAGGELPPIPPLQATVAPPPPTQPAAPQQWTGPAPTRQRGDGPVGGTLPNSPWPAEPASGQVSPFAAGPGPGPDEVRTAGHGVPQPLPPSPGAGGPTAMSGGADAPSRPGHEVAPGVFTPPWNGAADATRAAIDAPTQALPTQRPPTQGPPTGSRTTGSRTTGSRTTGSRTTGSRTTEPGTGQPGGDAPGGALGWGSPAPSTAPPSPGNGAWGGSASGNAATAQPAEPWWGELEPARERLPQAFGPRPGPAASPPAAVEVAPVSLHGPMAAAAARDRARGRSATVAAFVAAAAAVVAALLVLTVVLRKETEPPRVGAVPEISAGQPVPNGPALGGEPPTDLLVREDGDALLLTWTDPTAGTVPFIVAAGRAGTQLRAMATIEPGATRYLANGLSNEQDYCFTVVAVYSTDKYAASGQVCTTRTADAPR